MSRPPAPTGEKDFQITAEASGAYRIELTPAAKMSANLRDPARRAVDGGRAFQSPPPLDGRRAAGQQAHS